MLIPVQKLLPLAVAGGIATHGKDALEERAFAFFKKPQKFLVERSMQNILYAIRIHTAGVDGVDFGKDTDAYIRRVAENEKGSDPSKDPWGTSYKLILKGNQVIITSAGADKVIGSADDLSRTVELLTY